MPAARRILTCLLGLGLWCAARAEVRPETLPGLTFGDLPPREVWVYVPPGGVTVATPVLVVLDGQMMAAWRLEETLTALAAQGRVAVPLVVAIAAGEGRSDEYGLAGLPDFAGRGGKAAAFERFVLETVLPAVRQRYGVPAGDPARTGVMGASQGGLVAFDLAWRHSDVFGFAGIFSGSFWWRSDNATPVTRQASRLALHLADRPGRPPRVRLWFEAGTSDETDDRDGNGVIDAIQDTTELMDVLARRGLRRGPDLTYVEVAGGRHNETTWAAVLPRFLEWALPPAR